MRNAFSQRPQWRCLFFFILIFALPHTAEAKENCRECHSGGNAREAGMADVYAEIEKAKFEHDSVLQKCDVCHVVRAMELGRTWELDSFSSFRGLIFFLRGLSLDKTYDIELKATGAGGKEHSFPLTFRPYEVRKSVDEKNGADIEVRDARVAGIKEGVFLEAVFKWKTRRPTAAKVEYGLKQDYGEKSVRGAPFFTTDHLLRITGLKREKIYHYRIIAGDVFGNLSASRDLLLDTSSRFEEPPSFTADEGEKEALAPRVRLFRIDSTADVCIEVASAAPVTVKVKMVESMETGKHGPGLTSARDSQITVCITCHKNIVQMMVSHPVGMEGMNPGIEVPPQFPTIEGKVITCVTCHFPHGGDEVYLLRFLPEKDPCGECHKGGTGIP
ncbi:MAG: hypothetical protein HY883_05860 [Deltaproteobacteria bacterium]|nr:hypothetical protein [Deltaproteobacteria bacterium]